LVLTKADHLDDITAKPRRDEIVEEEPNEIEIDETPIRDLLPQRADQKIPTVGSKQDVAEKEHESGKIPLPRHCSECTSDHA
jgi:hypothetical protein